MQLATRLREMPVMTREDDRPLIIQQGLGERLHGIDIEMVARFIEKEHVVLAQHEPCQTEVPGPSRPRTAPRWAS